MTQAIAAHRYDNAAPTWANAYLWPVIEREVKDHPFARHSPSLRAFDLGCGSGATAAMLAGLGFEVTGIDPSESGINLAKCAYRQCRFEVGSAYDDLAGKYGRFPLVVSLEVIEHCYDPRRFARTLFDLVEPRGIALVSTPYHGYLKNVALALAGKLDQHFTALWDGGHIKFFSMNTLGQLLTEAGFKDVRFVRVGRIPPLAKSMIAVVKK
jgi:2-polyprenyl-3-methyl-5-hydroxy-6-metoxy-1,4-benzoquinol methylase